MNLTGQVAFITGASHGLGLATARALAAEGASIACLARPGPGLDQAVASLAAAGATVIAVPGDVTREPDVQAALRATLERWGRLDIAVLNAGTWEGALLHETSLELWNKLIDLNLKGAFFTLKHVAGWMIEQKHGTIVGIDSIGGLAGQPGSAVYAASKWGLRGLLESAALELRPHGIRVSLVFPHNINSAKEPIATDAPERRHKIEPEEIAGLIAFLCAAPDHVHLAHATVWPQAAGISVSMK